MGRATSQPSPRRRAGLGLIEAIIALAVCSALLTAVGLAFTTASRAINENDEFFQATHTGRVALARMLTQVRRGSVDDASTSTSLHLITDTNADVRYTYNPSTRMISMTIHANGVDTTYPLARNVEGCTFSYQSGTDFAGNPCVSRVSASIAVKVDNNQVLFAGTGVPRRNLTF